MASIGHFTLTLTLPSILTILPTGIGHKPAKVPVLVSTRFWSTCQVYSTSGKFTLNPSLDDNINNYIYMYSSKDSNESYIITLPYDLATCFALWDPQHLMKYQAL